MVWFGILLEVVPMVLCTLQSVMLVGLCLLAGTRPWIRKVTISNSTNCALWYLNVDEEKNIAVQNDVGKVEWYKKNLQHWCGHAWLYLKYI